MRVFLPLLSFQSNKQGEDRGHFTDVASIYANLLEQTKDSVYITKEFNSHKIDFQHQHARCFIVLECQYGCRDVM